MLRRSPSTLDNNNTDQDSPAAHAHTHTHASARGASERSCVPVESGEAYVVAEDVDEEGRGQVARAQVHEACRQA